MSTAEASRAASEILHQGCPVDHSRLPQAKTLRQRSSARPILRDEAGRYHIYGYAEARAFLRAEGTKQAGFQAERLASLPQTMRQPVLFQEGRAHHEQRTKIARFFTPKTTDERYHGFMARCAEELITEFKRRRRADLSELSMRLAVQVAAQVVGLTDSRRPGMSHRIEAFFDQPPERAGGASRLWAWLKSQVSIWRFFFLDVQPAIRRRRKAPQEDVVSHLLEQGYRPSEILIECVTYASAGMATTREFISMAAWHLLEHPELRAQYLAGEREARYKLLHELLRLEPVVGTLFRRTTEDLSLESKGARVTIPAGAHVALHLGAANADERVLGEAPLVACPVRTLPRGVPDAVMSFGDGHHRCPGAYVAIQESDIFLRQLLSLPGLVLEHPPELRYNQLVQGFELREFMLRLEPAAPTVRKAPLSPEHSTGRNMFA